MVNHLMKTFTTYRLPFTINQMYSRLLDKVTGVFELDLPKNLESLDDYVEFIVPKIQPWTEDLSNQDIFVGRRWLEIRDTDTYHEKVLHIFMPGGEYLISIDGDVSKGGWKIMNGSNAMILDYGGRSQLFDLEFLNDDFFILGKNGDQSRKGKAQYAVYADEELVENKNLDWRNVMEELYNIYRSSSNFSVLVVVIILILVGVVVYSVGGW